MAAYLPVDPEKLTADLIRCASVTPDEGGALGVLAGVLQDAGFACTRVDRGGIANLYARWGVAGRTRASASTVIPMWCRWAILQPGRRIRLARRWWTAGCMAAGPPI